MLLISFFSSSLSKYLNLHITLMVNRNDIDTRQALSVLNDKQSSDSHLKRASVFHPPTLKYCNTTDSSSFFRPRPTADNERSVVF